VNLALWIDMSLQIVIGGAIVAFIWAVIAQGVFTRTVDGFSDWYIGSVAPAFGVGAQPIWADAEYREGFFVDRPEAPTSITYRGPREIAE